jgi:hypothetical protein
MRIMNTSRFAPVVLLLAAGVALAAQEAQAPKAQDPPAAEETPTFPAQVEQVIVDTVVTDKKGGVIKGLTREDFTVLEDGVPRPSPRSRRSSCRTSPPRRRPLPRGSPSTRPPRSAVAERSWSSSTT